jgi:hypothetical protein
MDERNLHMCTDLKHPRESTKPRKASISNISLLDSMAHDGRTVLSEHWMKKRRRLFK